MTTHLFCSPIYIYMHTHNPPNHHTLFSRSFSWDSKLNPARRHDATIDTHDPIDRSIVASPLLSLSFFFFVLRRAQRATARRFARFLHILFLFSPRSRAQFQEDPENCKESELMRERKRERAKRQRERDYSERRVCIYIYTRVWRLFRLRVVTSAKTSIGFWEWRERERERGGWEIWF